MTAALLALMLADPADEKLTADEQAIVDATNAERVAAGLPKLVADPKLMTAARDHAANMAKQSKLEHTLDGKTAGDRVTATGYRFSRSGENIGWKYPTPKDAVTGWMASDGHKRNLLTREFTATGVAVATSAKGEKYWVQVFATPR